MSSNKSEKKKYEATAKKYRIFIRNDETLQQIFSLKLNFPTIYILLTSAVVLCFFITWVLIAYTPLKRLMPGYEDVYMHPEYIKLNKKVDEVAKAFDDQQFYIESFRALLLGESADSLRLQKEVTQVGNSDLFDSKESAEISGPLKPELPKGSGMVDDKNFIQMNKEEENKDMLASARKLYLIPPVKGVVINSFDPLKRHYGIDLSAPKNTAVKAILEGHVISSDWTLETGNTIGILHDNKIISFYKHNAANLVPIGTYVQAGEAVAIIGNTGTQSSGPHLHFELWINGTPVNPVEYINF